MGVGRVGGLAGKPTLTQQAEVTKLSRAAVGVPCPRRKWRNAYRLRTTERAFRIKGEGIGELSMHEAHSVDPLLKNAVKLVVWDLDNTFWRGVLSEEGVTPVTENVDLVKRLAAKGIVSSICSKNDRESVIAELQKLGVWDYFVLPRISFQPKGSSIAALIEALQLRSANVVFIDDNPSMLAEAAFTCPGLQCLESPAQLAAQLECQHRHSSPISTAPRTRSKPNCS